MTWEKMKNDGYFYALQNLVKECQNKNLELNTLAFAEEILSRFK